jgi:hypothetical protein
VKYLLFCGDGFFSGHEALTGKGGASAPPSRTTDKRLEPLEPAYFELFVLRLRNK